MKKYDIFKHKSDPTEFYRAFEVGKDTNAFGENRNDPDYEYYGTINENQEFYELLDEIDEKVVDYSFDKYIKDWDDVEKWVEDYVNENSIYNDEINSFCYYLRTNYIEDGIVQFKTEYGEDYKD